MKKQKTRVVLLFGGASAEHEVSLSSARAVHARLDRNKFEVLSLYIGKDGHWRLVDAPPESALPRRKGRSFSFLPWGNSGLPEMVRGDIYFPVLHGPYGEDGTIQGLLEMADVPFVGAGVTASAVGMDKDIMKTLFRARGLPVVDLTVVREREWREHRASLVKNIVKTHLFPLFVKPARLGSSVGITKVTKASELVPACEKAFVYDRKILVEQGIVGRELECSVLGNDKPEASLPGELIPYREFYDYDEKYLEGRTRFEIPARLKESTIKEVQRLAVSAFQAIDGSGMARVDFFLEGDEHLYVNEINTIPGFTEISLYPRLWEASGLGFSALLEKLIQLGFDRHKARRKCLDRNLK